MGTAIPYHLTMDEQERRNERVRQVVNDVIQPSPIKERRRLFDPCQTRERSVRAIDHRGSDHQDERRPVAIVDDGNGHPEREHGSGCCVDVNHPRQRRIRSS